MKRTLLLGAMLYAMAALMGCGDKVDADLIIGDWTNTAQSGEITIAGQENIPEGTISMVFTADSVLIVDVRVDCIATWKRYTLSENFLHIEGGSPTIGDCIVDELSKQKMVLVSATEAIDMGSHYVMQRL